MAACLVAAPSAAAPSRTRLSPESALAERTRSAVVHVRGVLTGGGSEGAGRPATPAPEKTFTVGSGFVVDGEGGIVTNEHVIRGATNLRVRFYDGREFVVCVQGQDEQADIALLKIEGTTQKFAALPLGDSDRVHIGESVLAVGSPFGFAHSVTAGIVSANERVVEQDAERSGEYPAYSFYIQTDASINVGNSGGPLVDRAGVVIGVNAAFWGGSQPASGVGFAIPVNVVKLLLPQLRESGGAPRSFLGVESQPVTPALAAGLGLPNGRGALIAGIEKASAAEAAGLLIGDVVLSFGAHQLATRDDFRIFAELTPPGTRVKLQVLRAGKTETRELTTRAAITSTITSHSEDCRRVRKPVAAAGAQNLGFEVQAVPAGRAAMLPGKRGIQVVRVSSAAARDANLDV
ncbi:MAG TPA: trypsin-like peptidase domain-containing protein, partial [Polyangia bacterium]